MAERVTTAKEDQISKLDKQRGTDTTLSDHVLHSSGSVVEKFS